VRVATRGNRFGAAAREPQARVREHARRAHLGMGHCNFRRAIACWGPYSRHPRRGFGKCQERSVRRRDRERCQQGDAQQLLALAGCSLRSYVPGGVGHAGGGKALFA
jgi:hypothetical protein